MWRDGKRVRVYEHRLVMEQHLGRRLGAHEVVHHRNGNPSDNRVENLRVFPSRSAHQVAEHARRRQPPGLEAVARELVAAIEQRPGITLLALMAAVGQPHDPKRLALKRLVVSGKVVVLIEGRAKRHFLNSAPDKPDT